MQVGTVSGICLIAYDSFPNFLICLLLLQLAHHLAPSGAVHTRACIHALSLQLPCEPCPFIAAGHAFLHKVFGVLQQRPGQKVCDGLASSVVAVNGQLQP